MTLECECDPSSPELRHVLKLHLIVFIQRDMLDYDWIKWPWAVFATAWVECSPAWVFGELGRQETSLIHQDQAIKSQTDSIKGKNNYICHNNVTQQKHNAVSDAHSSGKQQVWSFETAFHHTFLHTQHGGVLHSDCDLMRVNVKGKSAELKANADLCTC